MLVVGKAVDLSHPVAATHGIQAVVQLLPRQLASRSSSWSNMLNYTVYQYSADTFEMELPCRIAGNVLIQGTLRLADDYPPSNAGQNQYLSDINSMQFFGLQRQPAADRHRVAPLQQYRFRHAQRLEPAGRELRELESLDRDRLVVPGRHRVVSALSRRSGLHRADSRLEPGQHHAGRGPAYQSAGNLLCQRQTSTSATT